LHYCLYSSITEMSQISISALLSLFKYYRDVTNFNICITVSNLELQRCHKFQYLHYCLYSSITEMSLISISALLSLFKYYRDVTNFNICITVSIQVLQRCH